MYEEFYPCGKKKANKKSGKELRKELRNGGNFGNQLQDSVRYRGAPISSEDKEFLAPP